MQHKKPEPLVANSQRPACPVCGQTSYSLAGIHPQCAVKQADNRRLERIRQRNGTASATPKNVSSRSWQKVCPKCRASVHVRRKTCDCGHTFAAKPISRGTGGTEL